MVQADFLLLPCCKDILILFLRLNIIYECGKLAESMCLLLSI